MLYVNFIRRDGHRSEAEALAIDFNDVIKGDR